VQLLDSLQQIFNLMYSLRLTDKISYTQENVEHCSSVILAFSDRRKENKKYISRNVRTQAQDFHICTAHLDIIKVLFIHKLTD